MRPAPRLAAVTGAVLTVAGLAACSAGPLATGADAAHGLVGGPTLAGVLAPYDGISRGVLGVLGEAGYGTPARPWPAVTGQDAEVESVRSVLAGEQRSTIYKDTRQLAEVAVTMVDALLEGRSPEVNDVTSYDNGAGVVPAYLLTPQLIDADNAEDVLVGGGFYTAEDLR